MSAWDTLRIVHVNRIMSDHKDIVSSDELYSLLVQADAAGFTESGLQALIMDRTGKPLKELTYGDYCRVSARINGAYANIYNPQSEVQS